MLSFNILTHIFLKDTSAKQRNSTLKLQILIFKNILAIDILKDKIKNSDIQVLVHSLL